MIPGNINTALISGAEGGGYQVQRSLRFNSSDSGFCSRTPGTVGTRTIYTLSAWVKRAALTTRQMIFSATNGGDADAIYFHEDNTLRFHQRDGLDSSLITTQVFRDASAWYHIVLAVDTTQGTSSNRVKIYVNGTQITTFSTATYPSSSYTGGINNTVAHNIGRRSSASDNYLDAYLADIHFIDGQALTPSSFTEVSATTGQLLPRQYTGSFGTNGFWLKFSDNSNNTATTLGKDYSGNSNNWTPNNLSVTAGAGNDSLVDTPSSGSQVDTGLGGQVTGNYATLNPLTFRGTASLANGNLDYTLPGATGTSNIRGTIAMPLSGKWYWEVTISAAGQGEFGVIDNQTFDYSYYWIGGSIYVNSSSVASVSTSTAGDVIGIGYDADNNQIRWYKNNVQLGSNYSLANTGRLLTYVENGTGVGGATSSGSINFGQRPFAYTAPSGFKALCDTNLPAPVVAKPSTAMDVKLYTGNGGTQTISGLGFSPDLVWVKRRSAAASNVLGDVVRGITKSLYSNLTSQELDTETDGYISATTSDGFTVVPGASSANQVNASSSTYVAWTWDAGSSTVTNTQGSITSQVRANASAGFSIVTWTGDGTTATIGHGGLVNLDKGLIIVKSRSTTGNWMVGHGALGWTQGLEGLNTTNAANTSSSYWNNTAPTSTVFTVSGADANMNGSGRSQLAYCFAPVAGYSSFGSYTGNGSADGPFVFCNFRPRWVLIKSSSASGWDWHLRDTARDSYNPVQQRLFPNTSSAESANDPIDILSNGFKLRASVGDLNGSGTTYIYAAFAESPFAYSRAR